MEAKQAISVARDYIREIYAEENISNLGLEEIEFNEASATWDVTMGFSRPWNSIRDPLSAVTGAGQSRKRIYKRLTIADVTGKVIALRIRETADG